MTIPSDIKLDSPLWQFAGHFWSRPIAQQACLELQARGWSVTDILCAAWLAVQNRRFEDMDTSLVKRWRDQVTEPLRRSRKMIGKNNPVTDPVRNCIARSELEAEKVELALAYRALTTKGEPQPEMGNSTAPDADPGYTSKLLALENLQAAAPEKAMNNETGRLLDILTEELWLLREKDNLSC